MTNPNDPYTGDPQFRDPAMTTRDPRIRRAGQWGAGAWTVLAVIAVLIIIGFVYSFNNPPNSATGPNATNPPPTTTGQGTNSPTPAPGNTMVPPGGAPAPAVPAPKQ
jgi:hypothetical protein